MKFLFFHLPGCYPCNKAEKVLVDHFSHIHRERYETRSEVGKRYGIRYSPSLVIMDDEGNVVGKLTGAHEITKIEVQGLISDFLSC